MLVHQCDTAEQRASCVLCPTVTPELAALHAVQALDAAGVEHDPGKTWTTVRQAVAEQIAWRDTVASLAAGEVAAEPVARALVDAGPFLQPLRPVAGGWSDEPPTVELGGWREQTSPVPPVPTGEHQHPGPHLAVRVETSRHAWFRTAVVISVLVVSVLGGVAYVVGTRPGFPPATPATGGGDGQGQQGGRQLTGDDTSDAGGRDASGSAARDGSGSGRTGATPTVPPTPTPPAPSSSPTLPRGNRTTTGTAPAPNPPAGEPAPSPGPSPSQSAPPAGGGGQQTSDPEPTPDPTTSTAPTCVLDVLGACVVAAPDA